MNFFQIFTVNDTRASFSDLKQNKKNIVILSFRYARLIRIPFDRFNKWKGDVQININWNDIKIDCILKLKVKAATTAAPWIFIQFGCCPKCGCRQVRNNHVIERRTLTVMCVILTLCILKNVPNRKYHLYQFILRIVSYANVINSEFISQHPVSHWQQIDTHTTHTYPMLSCNWEYVIAS